MALIHIAYTFNSNEFHSYLEKEIIRGGTLHLDLLQNLATSTASSKVLEITDILSLLRVDEDWLIDDEDGLNTPSELWYTLALLPFLRLCSSLNDNRFARSDTILELVLPLAGWSNIEISELIHGKSLSTLLIDYGNNLFLDEFNVYGGCLSSNDAKQILEHLKNSEQYFTTQSSKSLIKISEWVNYTDISLPNVLEFAYLDAIDMLQTALERKEALYLFRNF